MNIDRFARWYRLVEYAAFGFALERRRFAFLDRLSAARRVLVVGEGDGRALERLLKVASCAQVDVVESSREMIEMARRRIGDSTRVEFRHEDALTARWPESYYDGLIANFFLDCFSEAEAQGLIGRLVDALAPGGVWIVGEFAIPKRGWRRWHAAIWVHTMYRFFAIVTGLRVRTLAPFDRLLSEAGLRLVDREEERWGLIRSEHWQKPLPCAESKEISLNQYRRIERCDKLFNQSGR